MLKEDRRAGLALEVSTPPSGPSVSFSGSAIRAISSPAISRQRKTRVASGKPARWSAAVAWLSASWPAGPARPRRAVPKSVRLALFVVSLHL